MGYIFPEVVVMAKTTVKRKEKTPVLPTLVWQEWAKERAQHAPSLQQVYAIAKKVKINVTQLVLEERHGE